MHWNSTYRRLVLLPVLVWCGFPAVADTLVMTNGETYIGTILKESSQTITFESELAGKLSLPHAAVKEIKRSGLLAPITPHTNSASTVKIAAPTVKSNNVTPTAVAPLPFKPNDTYDWVQIKTGEWLKGKLKSLQNDKLEFDSEEFDYQTWDWEDVRVLRSPRFISARFDDNQTQNGSLFITTNQVMVTYGDSTNSRPRKELLSITPTGSREISKWSADLSLSMSFRSGNTREVDYTARATLKRRTPYTRLVLDYLGNYGMVNDDQTENDQRISTTFDLYMSRRWFIRIPDAEYYRDPLQNIEHRLTLGAGMGYELVKNKWLEWDVTAGPAFQRTYFVSVEPGQDQIVEGGAAILSTRVDMELTRRLDLLLEYRAQLGSRENGMQAHHAVATLEFEIHKRLDLDISLVWDRISSPEAERSGQTPSSDDVRLNVGLGIHL